MAAGNRRIVPATLSTVLVFGSAFITGCKGADQAQTVHSLAPVQTAARPLSPPVTRPATATVPGDHPDGTRATGSSARTPYSVEISASLTMTLAANAATPGRFTVYNAGPDIPDLSLCFAGDQHWVFGSARSDRTPHPTGVQVESGRGWDFGPLPHGATTHITCLVTAPGPGKHRLAVRAYALAEDEGDVLRSIDAHIESADKQFTVFVRASSDRTAV